MKNEKQKESKKRLEVRTRRQVFPNVDDRHWHIFVIFIIFAIISGLICLITFGSYIYVFKGYSLSKNPADWGPFGSYIGGVSSPILSFLNMVLIIYITLRIFYFEQKMNERSIQIQKKIVLSEMRQDSIKKLTDIIESGIKNIIDKTNGDEEKFRFILEEMNFDLAQFIRYNRHLFQPLGDQNNWSKLIKSIEAIPTAYSEYNKQLEAGVEKEKAFNRLKDSLRSLQSDSSALITKLQDYMLKELEQ